MDGRISKHDAMLDAMQTELKALKDKVDALSTKVENARRDMVVDVRALSTMSEQLGQRLDKVERLNLRLSKDLEITSQRSEDTATMLDPFIDKTKRLEDKVHVLQQQQKSVVWEYIYLCLSYVLSGVSYIVWVFSSMAKPVTYFTSKHPQHKMQQQPTSPAQKEKMKPSNSGNYDSSSSVAAKDNKDDVFIDAHESQDSSIGAAKTPSPAILGESQTMPIPVPNNPVMSDNNASVFNFQSPLDFHEQFDWSNPQHLSAYSTSRS